MEASAIIEILQPNVPGASYEVGQSVDSATIYVPADTLVATCRVLRDEPRLGFNVLVEVTAADYIPRDPRFEIVYHLLSVPNKLRLRLKVRVGVIHEKSQAFLRLGGKQLKMTQMSHVHDRFGVHDVVSGCEARLWNQGLRIMPPLASAVAARGRQMSGSKTEWIAWVAPSAPHSRLAASCFLDRAGRSWSYSRSPARVILIVSGAL